MVSALSQAVFAEVYHSTDLDSRPVSQMNPRLEKAAIQELALRMLEDPESVLPAFGDLAMELSGGISSGFSLVQEGTSPLVFRWSYLRGSLASFKGALTPRDFSPCGITLNEHKPVLAVHPERAYDWIAAHDLVVPEVLLVPLYLAANEPFGTLWIVADRVGHFHSAHARAAEELALFATIALRMARNHKALQQDLDDQRMLAQEMSHRVKNVFALTDGMLRMTAKSASSKEELAKALSGRIHALASAHSLAREPAGGSTAKTQLSDLSALLRVIVEPHETARRDVAVRFSIGGPIVGCGRHALNGLSLVFHELATNASKYGALTAALGHVRVEWFKSESDVAIHWIERSGPTIDGPPTQLGLGSRLLSDIVIRQFHGTLERLWSKEGLEVAIVVPLASLTS